MKKIDRLFLWSGDQRPMADLERLRIEKPERYQAILQAACAEFASHGYERANINLIAERVGVAKGTIYTYVQSKEDLFLQSVEYAAGRVIAHIKSRVSPKASPDERMRQFILADLTFMDRQQDEYMLMVSVFYGANFLYGRGKAYLLVAMGAYREFFALLEDICADWMGRAALDERGVSAVTMQVLTLIESANLYAWANPDEPVDRIRDADLAMTMLKGGLGPLSK